MSHLRILHVEDDPDDALFFFRAIKKAQPDCEFHRETNGEAAIKYLHNSLSAPSSSPPAPDLVILDLKLPGKSGFEVLAWVRAQAPFKTLPVVILSGSSLKHDQQKASDLGASAFLVKHSQYDQIAEQMAPFLSPPTPSTNTNTLASPTALPN